MRRFGINNSCSGNEILKNFEIQVQYLKEAKSK